MVKFPIDNKVGSDVMLLLVRLPMRICPDGWPLVSDGIVDRLLKA